MNNGTVAIVVAIIGAVATIIGLIITTIKDSNKVSSVKEDTIVIKPDVSVIKNDVNKVKDNVIENIVPSLKNTEKASNFISGKVDELYNEMNYHKRLQTELKENIKHKDYFIDGIEALYQTNGLLSAENNELKKQLLLSKEQNEILIDRVASLKKENKKLIAENQELSQSRDVRREHFLDL